MNDSLPTQGQEANPRGSVFVQLEVSGRFAVSRLVSGWSAEEKQALLDGDENAREALFDAAISVTLKEPDEVNDFQKTLELLGADQ